MKKKVYRRTPQIGDKVRVLETELQGIARLEGVLQGRLEGGWSVHIENCPMPVPGVIPTTVNGPRTIWASKIKLL